MNQLRLQVAPLDQLPQILPQMLQNLGIGRGQIAVDQLQSAIRENVDQIVLFTASQDEASGATILAAAVVLQPMDRSTGRRFESASLIHAGPLQPIDDALLGDLWAKLSHLVDKELRDRGVEFVQWATAPISSLSGSHAKCCQHMGFEAIAELEYLSRTISGDDVPFAVSPDRQLVFDAVDSSDEVALESFERLVDHTYTDTLDCPQIANYRTAGQTLAGYQRTQPVESRFWFRVEYDNTPVGCAILSNHAEKDSRGGVMELVYMGLVPESRGRGIGRDLLYQTILLARQHHADRMIMAVDKKNKPARDIYHRAGFKPILDEAIWVRSLV